MFTRHSLKSMLVAASFVVTSLLTGCAMEGATEADEGADAAGAADTADTSGAVGERGENIAAGISVPANVCSSDQEMLAGLCYTRCADGFWAQVTRCIETCSHQKPGAYQDSLAVCGYSSTNSNGWYTKELFTPNSYDRGAGVVPSSCPSGFVKSGNVCKPEPAGAPAPGAGNPGAGSSSGGGASKAQACTSAKKYWSQEQGTCLDKGTVEYFQAVCLHNDLDYSPELKMNGSAFPCVPKASSAPLGGDSTGGVQYRLPCVEGVDCMQSANPADWNHVPGVIDASNQWVPMKECTHPGDCP
jgi:hypothetical protein